MQTSSHHPTRRFTRYIASAGRDDEIEVAVFRFTLGIPGFDDALIPRVVGIIGGLAMLANHIASPQPVSAPQTRIEVLGAVLAAVGIAAPTLQKRLEELRPGRGRQAAAASVSGGSNVFALSSDLSESIKPDLAWASFALLKNANTCGLFVTHKCQVIMCRGILGSSMGQGDQVLQRATEAWSMASNNSKSDGSSVQLFEDRGAMNRAGLGECSIIPEGANTVAILPLQPLNGGPSSSTSALVLVSERERALSNKEIKWAQGVAAKLYSVLGES